MGLTDKDIVEFKKMYKKAFGKDLDDKEAYEKAINLIRMFELVYKPITKKEMEATIKRQKELRESNR